MFNRKSRDLVPEPAPVPAPAPRYPYGWAKCPLCDNGRKTTAAVCAVCAEQGLTYDWGFSNKTEILGADDLRRLRKPDMPQAVRAGDTITWGCHYMVMVEDFIPSYHCPFRVQYTVKQGAIINMGAVPEAMIIHMANTGHWTENWS